MMLTIVIPCECGMYRDCSKVKILNSSPETLAADLAKLKLKKPNVDFRVYGIAQRGLKPLTVLKHLGLIEDQS